MSLNVHATICANHFIYLCSDELLDSQSELKSLGIHVLTVNDLLPDADEFTKLSIDIYMMMNADVSLISNSSLSFFTAMLNTRAKIFMRPSPQSDNFVSFDPWNSHVLLRK
jgi:hypothetical protein